MQSKTFVMMLAIGTLSLGAMLPGVAALDKAPDGITAHIAIQGAGGDLAFVDDGSGTYSVEIEIFQSGALGWAQVQTFATLRVLEDTGLGTYDDQVAIGFTSDANGPVTVYFPADAVGDGSLDVFVTFSALGGDPVPTSHHQIAKNVAIGQGLYDLADGFDHHSTRVYAL